MAGGTLLTAFLVALHAFQVEGLLNYPNALISRLEHLLVDTDGAFRSGFKDAITPCSNYVNGPQTLGRQTSGQWLRTAFHDSVTAHVAEGTGGIDASIGFETLRAENIGSAFNDSLSFFAPFVDSSTSMADLIALGVVIAVGNCGDLEVPLRGGRVDATEAGPPGVPEPQSDLSDTLEFFSVSGFDGADAIGLTACGHSIGHIHHANFADVVPQSAVTPNNTGGGEEFDTTPFNFDINVVREYLTGEGQGGGPLVTTANVTVRSDLRLYESDGNATMKTLGQSREYFFSRCNQLFEKMINTVPTEVQLSDVIQPALVKPVNVTFDIESNNTLKISGYIRVLSAPAITAPPEIQVTTQSEVSVAASPDTGYSIWGNTSWYYFSSYLSTSGALPTNLKVASGEETLADFALQMEVFFVPSLSGLNQGTEGIEGSGSKGVEGSEFMITAAVFSGAGEVSNISAAVAFPTPQYGTLAPQIETVTVPLTTRNTTVPGFGDSDYLLYSGSIALDKNLAQMVSVDITVDFEDGKTLIDEYNHFL